MESVGVKVQNNGVVKTDDERIELHDWRTTTIKITENIYRLYLKFRD